MKKCFNLTLPMLALLSVFLAEHTMAEDQAVKQGLMIMAFDGAAWHPYLRDDKKRWHKIEEISNPSAVTWEPGTGSFFLKGDDRNLYYFDAAGSALQPVESVAGGHFTQPRADADGLVMVRMMEGKSRDTDIVAFDKSFRTKTLLEQASAQFHPYRHGDYLYYAHVSCRMDCKPLIQEIWRMHLITGSSEQLTLLNTVSYLHSVDPEGQFGFISSNKDEFYHLAKIDLISKAVSWLTSGPVTDSFPSIAADGSLYFIRYTDNGTKLMVLKNGTGEAITAESVGTPIEVEVPGEIEKVRYLELLN